MSIAKLFELLCSIPATVLLALLTLLAFGSSTLTGLWEINLQKFDSWHVMQLLTCHLLHWSTEHLCWDLGMFVLLGVLCERWWPRAFYSVLASSAVAIPVGVMLSNPELRVYRGLSGLDTALYTLLVGRLCIDSLRQHDTTQTAVFVSLWLSLWGKIVWEFMSGQVLFVQQLDFIPLPIAHAVGALVGTIVVAVSARPTSPVHQTSSRCQGGPTGGWFRNCGNLKTF